MLHTQNKKSPTRLRVESLENRDLMSYGVNLDVTSGIVTVGGTSGADMFRIDSIPLAASKLAISFSSVAGDQQVKVFDRVAVNSVKIEGNGGDDYLVNMSNVPVTTTTKNGGTVNTSLMGGDPGNAAAGQTGTVGVFTAGSNGAVQVDYLYRGAGYSGELGLYSLQGMDAYATGSAAYKQEAARRALSNSTLGGIGVSALSQGAKFTGNMPWEGDLNRGTYTGIKTVTFNPGAKFGIFLVPSGRVQDVYNNPAVGGATTPLFSIPENNPYAITPQLRGQLGDIDGHGSVFAFEDQRLDGSSDRDYNDMVFQVSGARGVATPIANVLNAARNMYSTSVGVSLLTYATQREQGDAGTNLAVAGVAGGSQPAAGVFTVGSTGKVTVDFRYDGGGFAGQLGLFSLDGMGSLTPGTAAFHAEALRRVLSETTLGHLVINDIGADAAAVTGGTGWDGNFNNGVYSGPITVNMTPGDRVAFILVPNSSAWWAMGNTATTGNSQPLYSFAAGNPGGATQMVDWTGTGTMFGFEDTKAAGPGWCDRDYNDVMFRTTGLTGNAPAPTGTIDGLKDMRSTVLANAIFVG